MNCRRIKINFLSSRTITIISFVIIIYASIGLVKITWQNYKVNQKIASIEKAIKKLEEENFELKNKITYYKTDAYRQRQAREKLNLQKPEEIVIVIPTDSQAEEKKEEKREGKEPKKPNYQAWWDYFFAKK
jgi:cell division protein FtsL